MSAAPFSPVTDSGGEVPELASSARPRRRRRRKAAAAVGIVAVLAAACGAAASTGMFRTSGHPGSRVVDNSAPAGLATVSRGTLSSQVQVNATLGYAGSYSVQNQASGVFTSLPAAGRVIRRGQVLYRVSNAPVVLLYGSLPFYRSLSEGMSGPDVRELNANLVALGYANKADIAALGWDYFGWETGYALEQYQQRLGVDQTGTLAPGQALFLPAAVRVTSVNAQLGGAAGPGSPVLQGTSTARQVTVALNAAEQAYVKADDRVTITLPDNRTTPGVVSSVGTVATTPSGSTTPVITVGITPTDPAATGSLDQAPVEVSITTAAVSDVLVVPVDALLATTSGRYAVETAGTGDTRRLVPVSLGLFDDAAGTVQVSGPGLAAGQEIVVPTL
jgi:peptidoglycan hydrolase-like protein with peptidoglycan-binding domain